MGCYQHPYYFELNILLDTNEVADHGDHRQYTLAQSLSGAPPTVNEGLKLSNLCHSKQHEADVQLADGLELANSFG